MSSDTEFDLSATLVRTLLAEQFPELIAHSVEYLHQGWDNTAFLVNGEWVFRFPKRRERQPWLESETNALRWLSKQRLPVALPSPNYVGKPGPRYPCGFLGYRMIAGVPGDRIADFAVNRGETARRVGELFTIAHSLEFREAESLGIHSFEWPLEVALDEVVSLSETVSRALPESLWPVCRPFLEGSCEIPRSSQSRRCLVHGDLVDEHLIFDERGCLSGVIDWGDCGICDPATDFAGLYSWLGEGFVREVLAHYGHKVDASFMHQVAFRARCGALTSYGYSLQGRDTTDADRLQMVLTAFGGGQQTIE